jgi:septal ring factor EnvC (AmiA/AmiB activator)
MFGLFKKQTPLEKLREEHKKLLEDSYKMSTINRKKSDELYAQAMAIEAKIAQLKSEQKN